MAKTREHDDVNALLEKWLSEVCTEWRQQHGRVRISPASEGGVADTLLLLAKPGVPPTVRAVPEVIVADSLSTLTPMVRAAWIRKELQQRLATLECGQAVPDCLLPFWGLLLTDDSAKAKETHYLQSTALDEWSARLDGREDALMHKEQLINERVAGVLGPLASTQASERELRSSLAERTAELETYRERLDEAFAAVADATPTLGIREADLSAARPLAEATSERAADSEQHAKTLKSQLATEIERVQCLVLEKARLETDLEGACDDAKTGSGTGKPTRPPKTPNWSSRGSGPNSTTLGVSWKRCALTSTVVALTCFSIRAGSLRSAQRRPFERRRKSISTARETTCGLSSMSGETSSGIPLRLSVNYSPSTKPMRRCCPELRTDVGSTSQMLTRFAHPNHARSFDNGRFANLDSPAPTKLGNTSVEISPHCAVGAVSIVRRNPRVAHADALSMNAVSAE